MVIQKTLFRDSVLCKLGGALVLIKVNPGQGTGKCPLCKGEKFTEGSGWDKGWTVCEGCHDFSALTKHLEEIEGQCI